jgi:AhpC/TSA family
VLLDFWFRAWPPCRLPLPHLERLHKTLGSQVLAIVAVNFADSDDDVARFVPEQQASFPLGLGGPDGRNNPIFRSYLVRPQALILG